MLDFKVTLRRILKNYLTTLINIFGLTIGLFVVFALMNYYQQESTRDHYHTNADYIYKAASKVKFNEGAPTTFSITFGTLAESLELNVADVKTTTRVYGPENVEVDIEESRFNNIRLLWFDYTFFDLFDMPGISGNSFKSPNDAIVSRETAEKLFDGEALGKIIAIEETNYTITGIANIPKNTVFQFDLVLPLESMSYFEEMENGGLEFETYALLDENADLDRSSVEMARHYNQLMSAKWPDYEPENFFLPLKEVYLNKAGLRNRLGNGDQDQLLIIITIAFVVLILALINYVNLQIASNHTRLLELRLKKILGAGKRTLIRQGIVESFMVLLVASALTLGLLDLYYQSEFSLLFGKNPFTIRDWGVNNWLSLSAIIVLVGIITGTVPSIKLFKKSGLTQQMLSDKRLGKLTVGLIIFQFFVTASLLTSILFVNKQLDFLRSQPKGYNSDQIVSINNLSAALQERYDVIKSQLEQHTGIISLAGAQNSPGSGASGQFVHRADKSDTEGTEIAHIRTLDGYAKTLELSFIEGGDFTINQPKGEYQFILNETAAKQLFTEGEPVIGEVINMSGRVGKIVGVVEDYHIRSFKHEIGPLALNIEEPYNLTLLIKVKTEGLQQSLAQIDQVLSGLDPNYVFDYQFLDDQFDQMYQSEIKAGKIITYATTIAFSISILGLLALSMFVINSKLKEIAIRKTLGGSPAHIFMNLSSQLMSWILIGNLIAIPISYYFSKQWVQEFVYQISLGNILLMSAISISVTLSVGILIILRKVHNTININPVDYLKYE